MSSALTAVGTTIFYVDGSDNHLHEVDSESTEKNYDLNDQGLGNPLPSISRGGSALAAAAGSSFTSVFYFGMDDHLWEIQCQSDPRNDQAVDWSAKIPGGSAITPVEGSAIATLVEGGDQYVYFLGKDSADSPGLYEFSHTQGTWNAPAPLSNLIPVGPDLFAATLVSAGALHSRVYLIGGDPDEPDPPALWELSPVIGGHWSPIKLASDVAIRGSIAAISQAGDPRVYFLSKARELSEVAWAKGRWGGPVLLGAQPAVDSPLAAISAAGGSLLVYFLGTADPAVTYLCEFASGTGDWGQRNVSSQVPSTPAPAPDSGIAVTQVEQGFVQACFIGSDNHVYAAVNLAWKSGRVA